MITKQVLRPILDNDALTRSLADTEARVLIEWLVEEAERVAEEYGCGDAVMDKVHSLCERARSISRFVCLWNDPRSRGAAYQLAATERFSWPLPTTEMDPYDLMLNILIYETPDD